jgi:hypothetical protein
MKKQLRDYVISLPNNPDVSVTLTARGTLEALKKFVLLANGGIMPSIVNFAITGDVALIGFNNIKVVINEKDG